MYELRCLGEATLRGPAGDLVHFRSRKHLALLIYLALNSDRAHRRERLASLLWSDSETSKARHSLSQALYAVRRLLNGTLRIEGEDLELEPGQLRVDALELERCLEAGDVARAAELYRGEFLEGFWVRSAQGFEEWAERERARVGGMARESLRCSIREARSRCEWSIVRAQAERLIQLDPFDEAAYAELMRALWMCGDRGGALDRYEQLKAVLTKELDSKPSEETEALADRIRTRSVRGGWQGQRLLAVSERAAFPVPPFVGRKRELAVLAREWDHVRTGETRAVALVGEAGIGKTRLATEFINSLAVEDVVLLRSRCYEAEQVLPYGPVAEAFRDGLEALDLRDVNRLWLAELARIVPEVGEQYGELPVPPELEAEGSRRRLYEGIAQVLRAACELRPVLLFVDDLHWADESSLALIHYLLRRVTNGLYLVTAHRPDELSRRQTSARMGPLLGEDRPGVLVFPVEPLGDSERLALLSSVVGDCDTPLSTEELSKWSAGNPFFAVELARDHAAQEIKDKPLDIRVPQRIRALFNRKFEYLSDRAAPALEQAAILGSRFTFEDLAAALGLEILQVQAVLRELSDLGVLESDDLGIRFRHDLIRQAAREQIPAARSRFLHMRAARALIRSGGNPAEIARHLSAAKDGRRAYAYAIRGSKLAKEMFAHEEAADLLELAVENAPDESARARLSWQLGLLYWQMRRYDRAGAWFSSFREQSSDIHGQSNLVDHAAYLTLFDLEGGQRSPFESVNQLRGLYSAEASAQSPKPVHVSILKMLVWIAVRCGHRQLLDECAAQTRALHKKTDDPHVRWSTARLLGICECYSGSLELAGSLLREALSNAELAGEQQAMVEVYVGLSVLAVRAMRQDLVDELLQTAVSLSRACGDPVRTAQIQTNCALCLAHCEKLDAAEALLLSATDELGACYHIDLSSAIHFNLGYVAYLRGNNEEAERLWADDLGPMRLVGATVPQAGCLAGLGLIALRRRKIPEARVFAGQALRLVRKTLAYMDERHLLEELVARLRLEAGQEQKALKQLLSLEMEAKDKNVPLFLTVRRLRLHARAEVARRQDCASALPAGKM